MVPCHCGMVLINVTRSTGSESCRKHLSCYGRVTQLQQRECQSGLKRQVLLSRGLVNFLMK